MTMREIQKMQQKLLKMQEELEQTLFTGTAGGGAVTVVVNGKMEVTEIKIDPEAFNADDIAELEVMALAACKDAQNRANEAQSRLASNLSGGLKIPGLL